MRGVLTVVALLVLCVPLVVWAQEPPPVVPEGAPPGAEAVPLPPEQPLPPEAMPPEAMPPEIVPPAEPTLAERAAQYYERAQQVGPEVAAWLAANPQVGVVVWAIQRLARPLIFVFLLLLIGYGGRSLLRPLLGVSAPPEEPRRYATGESEPRRLELRRAGADLIAWTVALAIACEAVGLTWAGALLSGLLSLVGALFSAAFWVGVLIVIAALFAWSFSTHGRQLVLSLLGFYFLNRDASRPPPGYRFVLADGREATAGRTDALHTLMQPVGGGDSVLVPNADLMRQYYHWAGEGGGQASAGG